MCIRYVAAKPCAPPAAAFDRSHPSNLSHQLISWWFICSVAEAFARLVRELRMALAMVVSARSPVISIRHAAAATSPIGSSRPGQRPRLGAARTAVAAALLLYLGEEA
jgi:hypothetical protein